MTDDYRAYKEIKNELAHTDREVFSYVAETKWGYDQKSYMKISEKEKHGAFIDFLIDIEIAKNSDFFIGSHKSNIFRLVHYLKKGRPEYTTQDKMTSLFGLFGLASVRFGQVRRQAWRAFSGSYNIQRRRTSNPTRNHDFERRL